MDETKTTYKRKAPTPGQQHPSLSGTVDILTAAGILGVHECTIRRWIAQGRLPARRVGPKLIRIRKADVEAFITPVA